MSTLFSDQESDLEPAIAADDEPEIPAADEPEIQAEAEPATSTSLASVIPFPARMPLAELLPADFDLPALIKWVPNPALRRAADEAGTYALALKVDGLEGLKAADTALAAVRTSLKAIEEAFFDPVSRANEIHKRLTGIRSEWTARGRQAIDAVGRRIYDEQRRLDAIAAEERRKAQAEADRQAREAARLAAAEAARQQAPAPIVEELKRQAETVTAPPVAAPALAPPPLAGNTVVKTWKARIAGTPGCDDPNPSTENLSEAQRGEVFKLLHAIGDGKAPLVCIDLNWKVLNARAKAEKGAFSLAGLESFEEGSVRAKSTRTR